MLAYLSFMKLKTLWDLIFYPTIYSLALKKCALLLDMLKKLSMECRQPEMTAYLCSQAGDQLKTCKNLLLLLVTRTCELFALLSKYIIVI